MKDLALTVDCGTRGMRAVLFSNNGQEIEKVTLEHTDYYSTQIGWKEAPAEMFWNGLCDIIKQLRKKAPLYFDRIAGITLACQRDTGTILDNDGEAMRDFISWMDRRTLEEALPIPQPWRFLFLAVGKREYTESFNKGTHAHWIKKYEADLWDASSYYVLLSTYLYGKLIGTVRDCKSDIAGHLPFNYKKKIWSGPNEILSQIIQIEREKLCPLVDSCQILGYISNQASQATGLPAGLPVIGSGTDKGCETIGVGCVGPTNASISLGTQATVQITVDRYFELMPFYPPFPSVDPLSYNPEVTVYSGFWMVNWFIETFAQLEKKQCEVEGNDIYEFINGKLNEIPVGSGGLILHPYWGMDSFKTDAKGSIIGFTEGQDKWCIYRAIIEGLAFALLDGLKEIENKTKTKVDAIALSGGGARSDVICQIMADIFGREIYRVQTFETTALGGAMAVFVGLDTYESLSDAKQKMVHKKTQFFPNTKASKKYSRLYTEVYRHGYARYLPLYKALNKVKVDNE